MLMRHQVNVTRPITGNCGSSICSVCRPGGLRSAQKRIVRTIIQEVIADIDADAGQIVLLIYWMGGIHTELRLLRRRRGQHNTTASDIIDAVRQLVLIANDDLIGGLLNRNTLTTGHGNAGRASA